MEEDKLAQPASVKALATGVINERSKYRQEERREGGLLQFQDKQSVRMATRGDHLHYSKQNTRLGNLTKMCTSRSMTRAAARGQKTNSFNCPGFCAVGSKCGKLEPTTPVCG